MSVAKSSHQTDPAVKIGWYGIHYQLPSSELEERMTKKVLGTWHREQIKEMKTHLDRNNESPEPNLLEV